MFGLFKKSCAICKRKVKPLRKYRNDVMHVCVPCSETGLSKSDLESDYLYNNLLKYYFHQENLNEFRNRISQQTH